MAYKDPEVKKQKRREWYEKNGREYHKEYQTHWKALPENKFKLRLQAVKRHYNLDAEEYLQMILDQNNCCAICHKQETHKNRNGDVRPLCVDHCHTTGKVRQLLCTKCNALLGHAFDNPEILKSAIEYLNLHKEN